MERSLSTRNAGEMREREAANRREPSLKKCHVIRHVIKMTPDTRHLGSVFTRRKQQYVQVHRN